MVKKEKKVSVSLSKVESEKLDRILEEEGFTRATEFFRHIIRITYSKISESKQAGKSTYDN